MALRSPMLGRYLVRNRAWNACLRANDLVLETLTRRSGPSAARQPNRLLLAIGGHIGDAVIATAVLRPIRAAWPDVEIGVVTGSWNQDVFAGHPEIRWFHAADHWKLDRARIGWRARLKHSVASHRTALRDIAAIGYDTAVDLYPYYPNSSRLLKRAAIPIRIGYASGGGGPLYTQAFEWTPGGHISEDFKRPLAKLGADFSEMLWPRYGLPDVPGAAVGSAARKLRNAGGTTNYVALHMGAGTACKCWPERSWVDVARSILVRGMGVVLTGAGARDAARTRDVCSQARGAVDLCGLLTWNEFRHILAGARVAISVDTAAAHVAAAEGTPTAVIMAGIDDPGRWRPFGDNVTVLTEQVPCSPCFRSNGCSSMSCISLVSAETVLSTIERHLT